MGDASRRFPSPFEVTTPAGAEGWEGMYPGHMRFSSDARAWEEGTFWFQDGMHHADVLYPFDSIITECWRLGLGQYNTRIFAVPPAYGLDHRVLNGYLYVTPIAVEDPAKVAERAVLFAERASVYYEDWDRSVDAWKAKMEILIETLDAITVRPLPPIEDIEVVHERRGRSSAFDLLEAYDRTIENVFLAWQYHFEMLNLGYVAYLQFFTFCKDTFPGMGDDVMAQMVAGTNILFFRPDDELRGLASLAVDLGIEDVILQPTSTGEAIRALEDDPRAKPWIEAWREAQHPWFNFSNGNGFSHRDRSWIDDPSVPWDALRRYVVARTSGEDLDRPFADIMRRREELSMGYRALLETDEERAAFDAHLQLARTVAGYIEDHNFYVEHWHHTVFWNKIRAFGRVLVAADFLHDAEDIFLLNRWEVGQALYELAATWATGAPSRGRVFWPATVTARKGIVAALEASSPPPALGPAPDEITEPLTVMLWGITTDRVEEWLGSSGANHDRIVGVAASPGVAEGSARVIASASQLLEVQDGEILVAPITSPSWGPVFGLVAAAITDIGGMMSHAAIVSREYGLPAVVGAAGATRAIATGDLVRVDGGTGEVLILERASAAGR